MRMTAAILRAINAPLSIEDDIDSPALGDGQLLVKLAFAGVCQSQLMEIRGLRGPDRYLPHMLGHEGTGIVMEVGKGVAKVAEGDRVVLGWIRGDGAEVPGTTYSRRGEVINAGAVTTFSTHAVVSENRCTLLPDGIPMDVGTLFGCAVMTGIGIVDHEVDPPPGSSIAVVGLGGIGMSALMGCTLRHPGILVAIDVSEEKLDLARRLGATHTINAAADPLAALAEITGGRGVDFAIEAAGRTSTIELAFAGIRRGGLCVFASHPPAGQTISIDPYELIAGKRIRGSWGGACKPDLDVPRIASAFVDGRLPLREMIEKSYALADINVAVEDLAERRAVRPLIEIDSTLC